MSEYLEVRDITRMNQQTLLNRPEPIEHMRDDLGQLIYFLDLQEMKGYFQKNRKLTEIPQDLINNFINSMKLYVCVCVQDVFYVSFVQNIYIIPELGEKMFCSLQYTCLGFQLIYEFQIFTILSTMNVQQFPLHQHLSVVNLDRVFSLSPTFRIMNSTKIAESRKKNSISPILNLGSYLSRLSFQFSLNFLTTQTFYRQVKCCLQNSFNKQFIPHWNVYSYRLVEYERTIRFGLLETMYYFLNSL